MDWVFEQFRNGNRYGLANGPWHKAARNDLKYFQFLEQNTEKDDDADPDYVAAVLPKGEININLIFYRV